METAANVAETLLGYSAKAQELTLVQGIVRALLIYIVLIIVVVLLVTGRL